MMITQTLEKGPTQILGCAESTGVSMAQHNLLMGISHVLLDGSLQVRIGHYRSSITGKEV
jgi:hypothetical protein